MYPFSEKCYKKSWSVLSDDSAIVFVMLLDIPFHQPKSFRFKYNFFKKQLCWSGKEYNKTSANSLEAIFVPRRPSQLAFS